MIILCVAAAGCRGGHKESRRFELNGKVVSVDRQNRRVTIAHREIPGYMAAMTMPFTVKDEWALPILAPGQTVRATLVVDGERSWLEEITITEQSSGTAGKEEVPGSKEPEPGAEVPDFKFIDQDGRPIHISQYRDRALLMTFIYTRCPLPDYCPRMSRNFSEIQAALVKSPQIREKVQLLSISFDPEFDTPQVLRQYGLAYASRASQDPFRYWTFASGSTEETKKSALFFGLSYWRESGQIIHALRTALIGPDGRLVRVYHGNDWTPDEVIAELERLVSREGWSR